MTTLKTTPQEIQIQTSTETHSWSPFSWDIKEVLGKLSSILSKETQNELQEKSEKMKYLLKQLEEAVKNRSNEINYDYETEDYSQRLCQDDNILEKTLNEKVLVWNIKVIYDEIIHTLWNNEKYIKVFQEKLYKKFLEDLIYESMIEVIEKKLIRVN